MSLILMMKVLIAMGTVHQNLIQILMKDLVLQEVGVKVKAPKVQRNVELVLLALQDHTVLKLLSVFGRQILIRVV
uniref:Putative secreted protein n=1 Tax=Panstrongylus lignarius TaxID=156445 RepID=A0A224Y0F5_9HEMI